MALIKLNYELAISQAKKLEEAANRCAEMAADGKKQISALEEAWAGKASEAMREKLEAWCSDVLAMETTLNSLAARVRAEAGRLMAADEAAVGDEENGHC